MPISILSSVNYVSLKHNVIKTVSSSTLIHHLLLSIIDCQIMGWKSVFEMLLYSNKIEYLLVHARSPLSFHKMHLYNKKNKKEEKPLYSTVVKK